MPLPPKPFHGILELASRWQVDPVVIVGWAIEGRLALSAALPQLETADGCRIGGLLGVAGEDVFALFDGEPLVRVQRFRRDAKSEWQTITAPSEGVPVRGASVVIARQEAERFERAYRLFVSEPHPAPVERPAESRRGAPARYDWDAFSGAMARRVFEHGMPEGTTPGARRRAWRRYSASAARRYDTERRAQKRGAHFIDELLVSVLL